MNETFPLKQTKFNSGEIAPALYGEVTNPKYPSSGKLCKNWIPTPGGPLVKRPGTRFIAPVKDATYAPRLIPFVFSDSQAFVLEVGNAYARFFQTKKYVGVDGALHVNGDATARYELATPILTAMLDFLTWAQTGNVITLCYGGQSPGTAAVAPQDLAHTSGVLIPWTIGATPLKIPINTIQSTPTVQIFAWANNVIYKAGDMVSRQNVLWVSIQNTNFNNDPSAAAPGLNAAGTAIQGTIWWMPAIDTSHAARTVSWVTTAVVQDSNGITYETGPSAVLTGTGPLSSDRVVPISVNGFAIALPAGYTHLYTKVYRAEAGGVFGWIGDTPSTTVIYQDTGNAANYAIQPPQGTDPFLVNGVDSFPSVVGYLDQRRLWADSLKLPNFIWLSKIGDLYNYDSRNTPGADTDSMVLSLGSDVLEQIRAFVPKRRGLILTSQGEWAVAGQGGGPISRSSQDAKKQSDWGSSWLKPLRIGTGILFNTAKSNMVRDLYPLYGLYADIWDGQDLTVLSRHLFDLHTLKDWAFQSTPHPLAWATRDDGTLLCMTYQHAPPSFGQQLTDGVVAWSQHTTGSADLFERVCTVPEIPEDAVYLTSKRSVGGVTVRWIERMDSPVPAPAPNTSASDVRYACFLDASLLYDGHNTNVASVAVIDSVAVPGSVAPADYAAGKQVKVTIAVAGPFVAADAANPYGSGFVFDAENALGLGVGKSHVVGFTSANVAIVEMDTDLTADQMAAWRAGSASWAIAKGTVTAAHLSGAPLDSGSETGARGVSCLVDGAVQAPAAWVAGVASLATPGVVIQIGLSYNSDYQPLDAWTPNAEIRNKFKNLLRVGFEVAYSRDLWVGRDATSLFQWQQRQVANEFGIIQPDTGYFEEFVGGAYDKTGTMFVRHFQPLPCTLSSILREMRLGDS